MAKVIRVNLYEREERGSLTDCVNIAKAIGCEYSAGEWNYPFSFHIASPEKEQELLEWLNTLNLKVVSTSEIVSTSENEHSY